VVIQEAVNQAQLLEQELEDKGEENRLLRQRRAGFRRTYRTYSTHRR
jgi:hypothetical protein